MVVQSNCNADFTVPSVSRWQSDLENKMTTRPANHHGVAGVWLSVTRVRQVFVMWVTKLCGCCDLLGLRDSEFGDSGGRHSAIVAISYAVGVPE